MVYQVNSLDDLKAKFGEAGSKLVVVDFYATWCGPCKMIAPQIEEMEANLPEVVFCKVDVDEAEDVAHEHGINAMPTFIFFKDGKKVINITNFSNI